jgi:hypothetical protein
MEIKYNTEIEEFDNYNILDEYIVVDDNFKSLFKCAHYFDNYNLLKVWKDGRITNNNNKELKYEVIVNEIFNGYSLIRKNNGHVGTKYGNGKYWIYGKNKYDRVLISDIIWDIYSLKYNRRCSLVVVDNIIEYNKILFKDENSLNCSLDNLKFYQKTNNGTRIFNNKNNYFDFNLNIPIDDVEFILCDEPVILEELPYFEIYKNGNIIDIRGRSDILIDKNGYQTISFKKKYFVHRLVAKSYLKNRNSYTLVNHLDGNRSNNSIHNLEWVNNSINTLHGQLTNIVSSKSGILKISLDNLYKNRKKFGNISLTSLNYRRFIKDRIIMESNIETKFWIFSHKTPLFLMFLPFFREFGQDRFETLGFYDNYFINLLNNIKDSFFSGVNRLSDLNIQDMDDLWLMVESINKYLLPVSKDDHLINILKILKIDFDNYIDWIFDDIKIITNDDVGFIFFEEMVNYLNILKMSDGEVFENDINMVIKSHVDFKYLRDEKCRDVLIYDKKYRKMIDYHSDCHRVVERIFHYYRYSVNDVKVDIESDYIEMVLRNWTFWKRDTLNNNLG